MDIVIVGPGGQTISRETAPDPTGDQARANADTLRSKAQAALAANTAYLALASPSTAQNTAQLKALTRQVQALIRLDLSLLDDVSGT